MISAEAFRALVSGQRKGFAASLLRGLLSCAELPYALAMRWRNRRFDRDARRVHPVSVPVISVGNLTLGGTGKTPAVIWLARWFRREGVRVSIVSRGYGQLQGGGNDEGRQLEACLPDVPHLQNADRVTAAETAIEELETQLVLLDDGFQHRRLARDLDLVLVDATEPFGYGHVFPRGLLREPLSGLRRADLVAITRANLVSDAERTALRQQLQGLTTAPIVEFGQRIASLLANDGQQDSIASLNGSPILAFCGIGNPAAFRQTLEALGAEIVDFRAFADHHPYDLDTMQSLAAWAASHPRARRIVCTHKDLVKVRVDRLGPLPVHAAMLDLEVLSGDEALDVRLRRILEQVPRD